jgi:hypothetical protein
MASWALAAAGLEISVAERIAWLAGRDRGELATLFVHLSDALAQPREAALYVVGLLLMLRRSAQQQRAALRS